MSNWTLQGFLASLTTTKGALLAAPLVVGTGLLLSIAASEQVGSQTATAGSAGAGQTQVAQATTTGAETTRSEGSAQSDKALFNDAQRAEIGKIVREYLLANPNVLVEISEELQRRQVAEQNKSRLKVLASSKDAIFKSPLDFVFGDADGDVTIVEYFDYNCGWCKRALNEVTKLTKADPKVRVVMKEFPIFGEHSEFAARAAMASKAQGKYWDFHVALMKERRVTKDNVFQIAAKSGLDVAALKAEMEKPKYAAAIRQTQQIATSLGIEGTPGFIIDGMVNPGFLPADRLTSLVAEVREKGCQFC